jgi:arabinoxylan arabinofuranohydrolase
MFTSRLARGHAAVLLLAWISAAETVRADNPVVQHVYTADPAPMVHGDTVYLCTSHDEDVTVGDFFTMNDWRVFSSKDMVNWTDHGSPLSYRTFSWATARNLLSAGHGRLSNLGDRDL